MDELIPRHAQPYSAEAEQSVIGSLLLDPAQVPDAVGMLKPEDFYFSQNRSLYEAFVDMFTTGQTIDAVTIEEHLRSTGTLDAVGGFPYIKQLVDITPTAAHMKEYAKILRDKSMLRRLSEVGTKINDSITAGDGEASDILENAERMLYELRSSRNTGDLRHIRDVLIDVTEDLEELAANKGKLPGIPTGIAALDEFISGLNKSDLILLASRPGLGKTSFALNIAMDAAKNSGKAVAVFQLEMSREQVASRMLSNAASVNSSKLRSGEVAGDEWMRIARAVQLLSGMDIFIDDNPGISVTEMKSKCRRMGDRLGLIIIDYLQLMTGSRRYDNRTTEVADISRSLKIMAKELNLPVLCLSQLSRATEQRGDKRPMLSDLRESGSIEQDADIVLFLYRDDYYADEEEEGKENARKNTALCIVAKNRHGSTGDIPIGFQGEYTRFSNLEMTRDAPPAR